MRVANLRPGKQAADWNVADFLRWYVNEICDKKALQAKQTQWFLAPDAKQAIHIMAAAWLYAEHFIKEMELC